MAEIFFRSFNQGDIAMNTINNTPFFPTNVKAMTIAKYREWLWANRVELGKHFTDATVLHDIAESAFKVQLTRFVDYALLMRAKHLPAPAPAPAKTRKPRTIP